MLAASSHPLLNRAYGTQVVASYMVTPAAYCSQMDSLKSSNFQTFPGLYLTISQWLWCCIAICFLTLPVFFLQLSCSASKMLVRNCQRITESMLELLLQFCAVAWYIGDVDLVVFRSGAREARLFGYHVFFQRKFAKTSFCQKTWFAMSSSW